MGNKANPKVSVIMVCYNHARYLPQRMESILSQTFTDYELILLDDASTDESPKILQSYADNPHVSHVVLNKENSGSPFRQWQKGLALAKGEYVWIAESDDMCSPDFLERTVAELDKNPKATVCFTGCECIGPDDLPIAGKDYDKWGIKQRLRRHKSKFFDGVQYLRHNMYWTCSVYNASGTLMRRSAYSPEMLDQSARMRNCGDYLFWSKMLLKGGVVEVYDKLNKFRFHQSNTTLIGALSGNQMSEDIEVLKFIEDNANVGRYRKAIRHGIMMKQTKRWDFPEDVKARLFEKMGRMLGATETEYKIERVNKALAHFLPMLLPKRDRL